MRRRGLIVDPFGGAPWTPASEPGLQVWLDASVGFTPAVWTDQSTHGRNGLQPTAARQPALAAGVFGALPGVLFDGSVPGSEKYMTFAASFALLTSAHVLIAGKRVADPPASAARSGIWYLDAAGASTVVPLNDDTILDSTFSNARKSCGVRLRSFAAPYVYEVASAAGAWSNWTNAVLQFHTAINVVASPAIPLLGSSNGGNFYDGWIGELLIFDHVLSGAVQTSARVYLANKWGVTLG